MFFTDLRTPPFLLLSLGLAALIGVSPSCCDKSKDYGYDYGYDDDTEDTVSPETVTALRDAEDDCVFLAEVTGRGEAMLRSAIVSGPGSIVPSGVQMSKDGGEIATAGTISSAFGDDDGWTAVFAASTLDGSPNGPVGTETSFDGTWSITLTVASPGTCADIEEPLSLKLVADD